MTKDQWILIWRIVYPKLFIQLELIIVVSFAIGAWIAGHKTDGILCLILAQLIQMNEKDSKWNQTHQ